jgi:hypothetical protein
VRWINVTISRVGPKGQALSLPGGEVLGTRNAATIDTADFVAQLAELE